MLFRSRQTKIHPATRTFQALRIAVNGELEHIKKALRDSVDILQESARVIVISFHSLEDRIVKNFFKTEEKGCVCPPKLPVCSCGHKQRFKIITRKPIVPTAEEVQQKNKKIDKVKRKKNARSTEEEEKKRGINQKEEKGRPREKKKKSKGKEKK